MTQRERNDRGAGNPKFPESLFSGVRSDSLTQLSVAHS